MSEIRASSDFMAVIEFQILPRWFELDSRTQRDYVVQVEEMMARYAAVKSRWYDADAWTSELSDFVVCEFADLIAYNELWSEMRRHPFLATPYAKIGNILMGMELEIHGLAQFAEEPSIVAVESSELNIPPTTSKPQKPPKSPRLKKPPSTEKPVKPPASTAEDKTKVCHYCGHEIKLSARYCSRCGTATELSVAPGSA